MNIASLGRMVLIAQPEGDRPAHIVKVLNNSMVDVTALMPMPEHFTAVKLHESRTEAVNGALHGTAIHAYWPPRT